jgi:hypothetical protein
MLHPIYWLCIYKFENIGLGSPRAPQGVMKVPKSPRTGKINVYYDKAFKM